MLDIRTVHDDQLATFHQAMMTTFGGDRDDDPDGPTRIRALIDPSRIWAAFDGDVIVATAATIDLVVGIPGTTLAMAGLTMVTVRPTHRRRGLMRALVQTHLDEARARGVPVSGLWSSEGAIYGRFGYGIAAEGDALELDTRGLTIAVTDADTCEWVDEAAARERLPAIYAQAIAARPGVLHRSATWWRERRFLETPFMRGGASRRRYVIVRRGATAVGYVVYRQRGPSGDAASGTTEIVELIAIDPRAEASLWEFVAGIDRFHRATWWNAPTDTTLPWIASDPRRVQRRRIDSLWLRIEDVATTLAARHYPADGELAIRVDDATWHLAIEGGRATCTRTDASPALRCDRATLGSMFLGSIAPGLLARAGRLHGDAAAVALADRLFAWPVAAWCAEIF